MSTQTNPILGTYLLKGTIGNIATPGAPIVHFSLVVTPAKHQVSGSVFITQATQNGNYSGNVRGTIYATGLGSVTQIVALTGSVNNDGTMPLELSFEAHLAVNQHWEGTGGFRYGAVHVDEAPVAQLAQ